MSGHVLGTVHPDFANPGDITGLVAAALPALTHPLPIVKAAGMVYYLCTIPAASMHRTDGKRLPFQFGVYATDDEEDQKYLNNEIVKGVMYLRLAKDEEVREYKMRIDPKGTLRTEVTAELEESVRGRVEAKIFEVLRARGIDVSAADLAGVDDNTAALNRLASGIRTGTATIIPSAVTDSRGATLMQSSIVGTDKLAGNAADSASTGAVGSAAGNK